MVTDLSGARVADHRSGAVPARHGRVILFVMDDTQREPRVAQETSAASVDESRETTTVALGPGRMLANPRRVRRA